MKPSNILIRIVFACLVLGAICTAQQAKSPTKSIPNFELQGISFTECQCTAYACPCRSNGHPTHGSCDAADFVMFSKGHYGSVDMTGFKAVAVGDLIDEPGKTNGTLYFDEKTRPDQRQAYSEMLGFLFGWNPPNITASKVVPIDFRVSSDKDTYTLTIPGILEEKGVMKRDANGNPLHVVPAMDLWGNQITYVDNVVFKYHDRGLGEWDLSGRQANVKEFHTTKDMYDQKKLLLQHGDMSGNWNAEQKAMIKNMGMKPE